MSIPEKEPSPQFKVTSKTLYVILLTGITLLAFFLARQYLLPVLLAAISAGIFRPVNDRIRQALGRPVISASVSLLLVTLIILLPLGVVGFFTVRKAFALAENIIANVDSMESLLQGLTEQLSSVPLLKTITIEDVFSGERLLQFLRRLGLWTTDIFGGETEDILIIPLQIFIYLYTLFFFLKEGDELSRRLIGAIPLDVAYQQEIMGRFVSVTGAILKSTVVIGSIHGVIGGTAVHLLGFDGAFFAGVLLLLLAVIPNVGAIAVWLPLSVVLLAQGKPVGALIMVPIGFVMGLIDYILRPRLVGRDIQIHQILVLIGVLGGMALFGIFGFIIGPIMISLFVILWQLFGRAVMDKETPPRG